MASVVKRIESIKQPRGGYISPGSFKVVSLNDNINLNETENINPTIIGEVVDYLTRYMISGNKENAFSISIMGAHLIHADKKAQSLLAGIDGLDAYSVTCACRLAAYDICYRAGIKIEDPLKTINPSPETIENIVIMVNRALNFWKEYGPVVKDGFTFEGGYTYYILVGDGDYLTSDTLWDFKVYKGKFKPKHTLQLLVYYLMGIHSIYPEFQTIKKLGIFNPRLNNVYLLDISSIPQSVIDVVSHDVIGYNQTDEEKEAISNRTGIDYDVLTWILNIEPLSIDQKIYGTSSAKVFVIRAFPSKSKINLAVYKRDIHFWQGNCIPEDVRNNNCGFIILFRTEFNLKEGKTPFLINRYDHLHPFRKVLSTSRILNKKGEYTAFIKRLNGETRRINMTIILTKEDYELFRDTYDVENFEILGGCYFL